MKRTRLISAILSFCTSVKLRQYAACALHVLMCAVAAAGMVAIKLTAQQNLYGALIGYSLPDTYGIDPILLAAMLLCYALLYYVNGHYASASATAFMRIQYSRVYAGIAGISPETLQRIKHYTKYENIIAAALSNLGAAIFAILGGILLWGISPTVTICQFMMLPFTVFALVKWGDSFVFLQKALLLIILTITIVLSRIYSLEFNDCVVYIIYLSVVYFDVAAVVKVCKKLTAL